MMSRNDEIGNHAYLNIVVIIDVHIVVCHMTPGSEHLGGKWRHSAGNYYLQGPEKAHPHHESDNCRLTSLFICVTKSNRIDRSKGGFGWS